MTDKTVEITLQDEFTYNGNHYGPGIVDAPNQETADVLTAAQDRLNRQRDRPRTVISQTMTDPTISAGPRGVLSPGDVVNRVEYANRQATAQAEANRRKAAATNEEGGDTVEGETGTPRTTLTKNPAGTNPAAPRGPATVPPKK